MREANARKKETKVEFTFRNYMEKINEGLLMKLSL